MLLYIFIRKPVHFNFSGNVSVTQDVGINNMITISHSESYQTLSSSDLRNCIKMGESYFCKERNVLLTDLTKTCIRSLYLASANNIQQQFKFSIGDAQERLLNLDSSTHVVYSLGTISTNHVCLKAKTIVVVQVKSGQAININPGCHIRTMDHVIMADETEKSEVHSKWLD